MNRAHRRRAQKQSPAEAGLCFFLPRGQREADR
jgi:hypothetical protein